MHCIKFYGGVVKHVDASDPHHLDTFLTERKLQHLVESVEDAQGPADADVILGEGGRVEYGDRGIGCAYIDWWERQVQVAQSPPNNTYVGKVIDCEEKVFVNGEPFDHAPSLKVRNHSPDGFNWGYGGSGPAQLALAILLNETGEPRLAELYYMDFKNHVISQLPQGQPFTITSQDVKNWIDKQ